MTHPTILGYRAACRTVELGRAAFFSGHDFDIPVAESQLIGSDDLLPQFGYVGSNYSARRILFLGINPGNGPRSSRNVGDGFQIPMLERFAAEPTVENFQRAQNAYREACQNWFIWGRECNELLALGGLRIDDIAFSNALPWRTRSEAAFGRSVERLTAVHYVKPLLDELQPRIVVAVGKKVQRMLSDSGSCTASVVVWNRARALTQSVREERQQAGELLRNLVFQIARAPVEWRHIEFARIISCDRCTSATDPNLLRDGGENVPQPGYIGPRYRTSRVLLVGQNPAVDQNPAIPKSLTESDRIYTAALRILRDDPTVQRYKELSAVLRTFIPKWPIHGNYFPLEESGLSLEDIGYFNIVRCRTSSNATPNDSLATKCVDAHFIRWLELLAPKVVVFVGKWAWKQGRSAVISKGIPCAFVNRQRSLSQAERMANRAEVAELVRQHRG